MKRVKKFVKFALVFTLIFSWVFSGWPPIWQNPRVPPGIQEAFAVVFPANSYLSKTASTQITSTVSWQIVTTAPASSDVTTIANQKKTTGYSQWQPGVNNTVNAQAKPTAPNGKGWIYDTALNSTIPTGTWTFNMRTTNSSATGTGVMAVCAWKVKVAAGAITSSTNIINCVDGATNLQANTTTLFVSSVSVTGVAATSFAADEYLYVEYWLHTTAAGGSTTAKLTFEANAGASDDIVLPGASTNLAPAAPSQDSPANSATGISVTPTFLMMATDPELNNLGYKVTIYSNSACTTVAQTNDQAVSSVGWTGTNATCTASPTACYTSGTQGSFLTQTALTANTQYWWKASAKDPDGSGTFTDSSTCNTFTTAASQTLTFSVSQSSAGFSTLSTSASTYANAAGTGSATEVEAHTLTASTNASGGYKITVQGATLTSGSNTIAAIGATSAAPSPGTPQFGLRINVTSGTGTATSPYGTVGQFAYAADASTASQVASGAGDGSSTVFSVRYLANISPVTPAGAYSTTLTYVATGTF